MHSKLTLRLKSSTIQKAKAWAKRRRNSFSQAMETFFDHIQVEPQETQSMSPWMKQLLKLFQRPGKAPTDEQARKQYLDYLERKYQCPLFSLTPLSSWIFFSNANHTL
ncbi:MAG: hypothetical protein NPIRA04_11170 [Nitrospirales bacterium]|nr:MAG: hypothetical protein NPIRA04_11170 [Nitrospirales bacterium]